MRIIFFIIMLIGCSSTEMTISINTTSSTNAGAPFYVLIQDIEEKKYLLDTYETVVNKAFTKDKDSKVFITEEIYPGEENYITFYKPEEFPVAVYFMFTNPGSTWKTLIYQPLPSDYYIKIKDNTIFFQE